MMLISQNKASENYYYNWLHLFLHGSHILIPILSSFLIFYQLLTTTLHYSLLYLESIIFCIHLTLMLFVSLPSLRFWFYIFITLICKLFKLQCHDTESNISILFKLYLFPQKKLWPDWGSGMEWGYSSAWSICLALSKPNFRLLSRFALSQPCL